eukprot:jgi/Astpho2/9857/Aster-x1614
MAGKCWRKYEGALRSHPLGTQIATSAILWAAGDCLAQRAETIGHKQKSRFNRRRVLLTGLYGAAIIECCIWPMYQTLNFARVPVQHQLLVCNLGSLLDSTFLCWARVNDGWVKLVLPGLRSPTVTAPISTVTDKVAHVVL